MSRPAALLLTALVVAGTVPAAAASAGATGQSSTTSASDGCIDSVAFYTIHQPETPPPFRVGFSADAGDRVFFVLETRGEVVGHTTLQTFERAIHADGLRVPLRQHVAGVRNVTVTVYQDSNGNGAFDAATDEPCRSDGEAVWSTLDFFVHGDGTGLSDTTVKASPAIAHQTATWTAETTVTRDLNVTHVAIDLRQAGSVDAVTPADVHAGYKPPVNATFVSAGQPADVSIHRGGVLRLSYPDGIDLENGSRLTVSVDGVRVPAERANVSLALTTSDAGYGATDAVAPKPTPHIEFYESFPEPGVHLRYGMARDITMFAVVFHDGEVVGTKHLDAHRAITMDGEGVPVEGVSGRTELTVRAYIDANDNGFFDRDKDRSFVGPNGEPIGETATIDLGGTSTGSSSLSATTTPMSSSEESSATGSNITTRSGTGPVPTPGLGVLVGFAALLGVVGLLVRE